MKVLRINTFTDNLDSALEYDSKGRITKFINEDGVSGTLTYYDDKIEYRYPRAGTEPVTFYLDANGRVQRIGGSGDQQFTYDAAGYLVSFKRLMPVSTGILYRSFTVRYEDGDLVEIKSDENPSMTTYRFTFSKEPSEALIGFDPLVYGQVVSGRAAEYLVVAGYFGKVSKHLMASAAATGPASSTGFSRDKEGRINIVFGQYVYTYRCP